MTTLVTKRKRIARPGTYKASNGTVVIDEKRIDHWVNQFNKMQEAGLDVPMPFSHRKDALPVRRQRNAEEKDSSNNGGWWNKLWKSPSGDLWGEVEATEEAVKKLGTTIRDVSLFAPITWEEGGVEYKDAIVHVAAVTHPVIKDTDAFKGDGIAASVIDESLPSLLSNDLWLSTNKLEGTVLSNDLFLSNDVILDHATDPTNTSQQAPARTVIRGDVEREGRQNQGQFDVSSLAELLDKVVNVRLPDGTEDNTFFDRLGAALIALEREKESQVDPLSVPPPGSKEQKNARSTVMANTKNTALTALDIALAVMEKAGLKDPSGNLYTAETLEPKPVILSANEQILMKAAKSSMIEAHKARMTQVVAKGRLGPAFVKEQGEALLRDLVLSIQDGKVTSSAESTLKTWESLPEGSCMTGNVVAGTLKAVLAVQDTDDTTLEFGVQEHENPLDAEDGPSTKDTIEEQMKYVDSVN